MGDLTQKELKAKSVSVLRGLCKDLGVTKCKGKVAYDKDELVKMILKKQKMIANKAKKESGSESESDEDKPRKKPVKKPVKRKSSVSEKPKKRGRPKKAVRKL